VSKAIGGDVNSGDDSKQSSGDGEDISRSQRSDEKSFHQESST